MSVKLTTDAKKVLKNIRPVITKGMIGGAVKGVKISAIRTIGKMQRKAPIDKGLLRSSGSVHFEDEKIADTGDGDHPGNIKTKTHQAILGFNTDYAFEQDTNRNLQHPKGGQAGYFSDTFRAERQNTLKTIAKESAKGLREETKGIIK